MEKILITGANGFLGRNIINTLLEYNYEIYATDKDISGCDKVPVKWIELDLTNKEQVKSVVKTIEPNYLMHLAWSMESGMQLNSTIHEKWIHISMDLFRSFAENGGKRIIVSGSCAEYKWTNRIIDENSTPIEPENEYGICKNMLHSKLATLCNTKNLTYAWARIFFMYGKYENNKRLVPYVIHSILDKQPAKTTHGNQYYDYLYAEDVAFALVCLLQSEFNGAVNICSGKPLLLKDLIYSISNKMAGDHLIQLGERQIKNDEPQFIVGSNALLKKVTNWKQQIELDEGINKTINFITQSKPL